MGGRCFAAVAAAAALLCESLLVAETDETPLVLDTDEPVIANAARFSTAAAAPRMLLTHRLRSCELNVAASFHTVGAALLLLVPLLPPAASDETVLENDRPGLLTPVPPL